MHASKHKQPTAGDNRTRKTNLLLVLHKKLVKVLLNRCHLPQVRLFPLLHLLVCLPRAPTR